MRTYVNRRGVPYYLPEYGPPVRWLGVVMFDNGSSNVTYYECDAANLGRRAILIENDGQVVLAYPGGPGGDHLPEGELPTAAIARPEGVIDVRGMTSQEFNCLWAALSRTLESQQ